MEKLLDSLAAREISYLSGSAHEILDWGCAFGDGVNVLANSFPKSKIAGIDFSLIATQEAKRRFPKNDFLTTAAGAIPRSFDILISSNCLQHFAEPIGELQKLLRNTRKLCFVMVPYDEKPLCSSHRASFREDTFPARIDGFVKLYDELVNVDLEIWPGKQLLAVYASPSYVRERPPDGAKDSEKNKWNDYYQSLDVVEETESMKAFHQQFAECLKDLLPPKASILEAGSGAGLQSLALATRTDLQVSLMDFSHEALQHARDRFQKSGVEADFVLDDVCQVGKPEFDLVFNAGVLEHYTLDEQARFLKGMASRSKKFVMVLVPNRLCYWYWPWRVQAVRENNWPWGKESPLADLSPAFEKAGLQFLGQTFLAESWTEDFIHNLGGIGPEVKQCLIELHRSPAIASPQKSYLVAALGCIGTEKVTVPSVWQAPVVTEDVATAELSASLADSLALKLGAESKILQMERQLDQFKGKLANLESAKAVAEQQVQKLFVSIEGFRRSAGLIEDEARTPLIMDEASYNTEAWNLRERLKALECQAWNQKIELANIKTSKGWALLLKLYKIRYAIFPHNSFRERCGRGVMRRLRNFKNSAAMRKVRSILRRPQVAAPVAPSVLDAYRPAQAQVLENIKASKGCFIFLPSVPWTIHLFQRPHHLARYLARAGYVSVYDCNGTSEDIDGFVELEPNLFLFKGPPELIREIPDPILWTFSYNYDQKAAYAPGVRTVYDWIDDLTVFPHDQTFLKQNHDRAMREATVVASVARKLHEEAEAIRPDAVYLPNGVEPHRFENDAVSLPNDPDIERLKTEGKPIAGYYGALAKWFDYKMLEKVAKMKPDWNFLLIGPRYDESLDNNPLLKCSNVFWIGPKPYEALPGYLKMFDVATIPFQINEITLATSPLKLYEYFSGGKPVVTTPMPECMAYPEVHIARNAEEFAAALDKAKAESTVPHRERLRKVGRENSWAARVQKVCRSLFSDAVLESVDEAPEDYSAEAADLPPQIIKIEQQFRRFRNPKNRSFFRALAEFFAPNAEDNCLPMWFEYAATTNDRGRGVAKLLTKYVDLKGKRYLDVGCAYGGFLVAFAEQGAEVMGFDINDTLLKLARCNLRDHEIAAAPIRCDATDSQQLTQFRRSFDIISCNDVIEHVLDPQATILNLASMLRKGGILYMEIPNRYHPRYVREDGHFLMFGITLLDFPEAKEFYAEKLPGVEYTVGHYFEIEEYMRLFDEAGIDMVLMEENFDYISMKPVLDEFEKLKASAAEGIKTVPAKFQKRVSEELDRYIAEFEQAPKASASDQRKFLTRYGIEFWRLLGRKRAETPVRAAPPNYEIAAA